MPQDTGSLQKTFFGQGTVIGHPERKKAKVIFIAQAVCHSYSIYFNRNKNPSHAFIYQLR
jgi:hypothetical protein